MKYVQFADEAEVVVCSVFAGPQDPEVYLYQGEVGDDDERYLDYIADHSRL